MEKVSEIRTDIAENAAHLTNKMLLQDLRAISQLFTAHCSSGLSDEDFYRFSIIKNAINTKNTDSLRRIEIIVSRSLGGIKPPCAGTKRGGWLMMEQLNKAEARKLFEENAVLIGSTDVLPVQIAKELLGAEVINATLESRDSAGKYYNIWGNDCKFCKYLTETGFFMAVTRHNIDLLGEPIKGEKSRICK